MAPWHISSSIATKFQRLYPYIYGVNLSGSGTVDVMGRRCVLKIEDGSQLTGSTNNFAGFIYTGCGLKRPLYKTTISSKRRNSLYEIFSNY